MRILFAPMALVLIGMWMVGCQSGPQQTESGLIYEVIEPGEGPRPDSGQVVRVHYQAMLEDSTVFDNSYQRGEPIAFPLGAGNVIPGWDEGIALMREGEVGRLVVPPELGYGERGAGGVIPPNATLIFEVELVEVLPALPPPPENPEEVAADAYTEVEEGLQIYDLEEGDGPAVSAGQQVEVHYAGWVLDGELFDTSLARGMPFTFTLGVGQVIPGWDRGIEGMRVGGKRQLVIGPDLAYGAQGAGGGRIPPNATLVFDVELLDVSGMAAPDTSTAEDPASR